jgi:phosphoglycolate phosphatase
MLFDCDGVLWKGSQLIEGSKEALSAFERQGKRLLFVTNNSSKSREAYCQKFKGLRLHVTPDQIISASYAAGAYLKSINFKKKVYLIGQEGTEDELRAHGIEFIGGTCPDSKLLGDLSDLSNMSNMSKLAVDPEIGAVVLAWDPDFSYSRLFYASICLREIKDCLFIATNSDSFDSISGNRMMPGTGCLLAALEIASSRKALVVGKEGPWLLDHLFEAYGVRPESSVMIGDRLDTDIEMGRRGGLKTVLTLSGVTTREDVERAAERQEGPDLVVSSIKELAMV